MKVQFTPQRRRKPGECGMAVAAVTRKPSACDPAECETMKNPVGSRVVIMDIAVAIWPSLSQGAWTTVNIETLHIGMKVRHPQYGVGTVRSLTEHTAEIAFDDAPRTVAPASSELEPAEATATLSELQLPLTNLIRDTAHSVVEALGLEQKDVVVEGLANRWQRGTLVMQSADSSLQPKEVPLETFFHKIVMIRNNLRVLEQKINANDRLSDADKFDLQQYITRCYGSLTTFNILFKNKDDQFRTGG